MGGQWRLALMNIVLLIWKAVLHVFGESDRHLTKVKTYARVLEDFFGPRGGIGTNHSITLSSWIQLRHWAKYPAYDPPKPHFPIELTTSLFLLSSAINTATGKIGGKGDVLLGGKDGNENLGFILNMATRIATPDLAASSSLFRVAEAEHCPLWLGRRAK